MEHCSCLAQVFSLHCVSHTVLFNLSTRTCHGRVAVLDSHDHASLFTAHMTFSEVLDTVNRNCFKLMHRNVSSEWQGVVNRGWNPTANEAWYLRVEANSLRFQHWAPGNKYVVCLKVMINCPNIIFYLAIFSCLYILQ